MKELGEESREGAELSVAGSASFSGVQAVLWRLMATLGSMMALGASGSGGSVPRDGQGGSAHTEAIGIHTYPWLCIFALHFHCSWEQGEVISG